MEPIEETQKVAEEAGEEPALIWEGLPAEKRREALQVLALLLVRQVEGAGDEQSA